MDGIDQGLSPEECVHHPRWHDQLGGQTLFEVCFFIYYRPIVSEVITLFQWKDDSLGIAGYNNATVAYLKGLGHNVTYQDLIASASHGV